MLRSEIIALRDELNRKLFEVCRLMPGALRTDAALFLLRLGPAESSPAGFNLIQKYYAPAYSVLHEVSGPHLSARIWQQAMQAHACAMFLHLFDDHLVDGQQPLSHLSLQLRTTVWQQMQGCLETMCRTIPEDIAGASHARFAQQTIDAAWNRYFRSAQTRAARRRSARAESATESDFERYCRRFFDEMATWLVVPLLLARIAPGWTGRMRRALIQMYHSFGLAWRLLDDLQDAADDARNGVQDSAVCQALSVKERPAWLAGELTAVPPAAVQLVHARLIAELHRARRIAAREGWRGLHDELTALAAGPGLRADPGA